MIFQGFYLFESSAVKVMNVQEGVVGAFYWSREGEGVVAWSGSERFFIYGLIIVHDSIYHWFAIYRFKVDVLCPILLFTWPLFCYMDIAMSIQLPGLARFSHHCIRIFVIIRYFAIPPRAG